MAQQIHKALVGAQKDICERGIAKLEKNQAQGYHFRGIEAAMNELSPILVKHGISVTPAYSELHVVERIKGDPKDGKATRFATIKGKFTFSAEDGSSVSSEVYGESMDSGDKAVVKAQSVAFRTALFQQFVVPTVAMDPESYEEQDGSDPELDEAHDIALEGTAKLESWWKEIGQARRLKLGKHLPSLKAAAAAADKDSQ